MGGGERPHRRARNRPAAPGPASVVGGRNRENSLSDKSAWLRNVSESLIFFAIRRDYTGRAFADYQFARDADRFYRVPPPRTV